MMTMCETCLHTTVCKFIDDAEKTYAEVDTINKNETPLCVKVECGQYRASSTLVTKEK